jgi:peroxiredoxin
MNVSIHNNRQHHCGMRPLGPKNTAPTFQGTAVVNGAFKNISLGDYNGKWLILFFYPLDL